MAAEKQPARLTDAQLSELLALTREVGSVELKLTVPDSERRATVMALGLDPLDAQIRQVFFFDTPDLTLDKHGVVARARRVQGRGDDSVVKLRPFVPSEAPADLGRSRNLVVEVDAMPGGYVCSASMKGTLGTSDVKDVAAGRRAIRKLYSKEQRSFFTRYAPAGVELDDLTILGPITVLKLKMSPEEFGRPLVTELWFYPDGSRILELSCKSTPAAAFQAAAEMKGWLTARGVDLSGDQQTKTRTALEYYSAELAAAALTSRSR